MLRGLFPLRLGLQRKLVATFMLLSTLPLSLMAVVVLRQQLRASREEALRSVRGDVRELRERTALFLTRIEGELRLLSSTTELRRLRKSLRGEPERRSELLASAEEEFCSLLGDAAPYVRVALLDSKGRELFRVSFDGTSPRAAAEDELTKTPLHYYAQLAGEMRPGDIRLSPSELRAANGEPRPAVDCVLPLFDETRSLEVILVASVDAHRLFELLTPSRTGSRATIAIANGEGRYLYHSRKKTDWNRLLATREEETVQHEYGQATASAMLGGGEGTATGDPAQIVEYATIFSPGQSRASRYVVFADIPTEVVFAPLVPLERLFGVAVAGVGGLSALLGVVMARRLVNPIKELIHGTQRIREGNLDHRIELRTGDELEELVEAVNQLAAQWQEKERLRTALQQAERRYTTFVRNASSAIWRVDFDQPVELGDGQDEIVARVRERAILGECNEAARKRYGQSGDPAGRPASEIFPSPEPFTRIVRAALEGGAAAENVESNEGNRHFLSSYSAEVADGKLVRIWGTETDITERRRQEEERERLISELQDTLAQVRTLGGLLPICAACKKIRDDKGYWSEVETYVGTHTEATFSHGICPDCAHRLYPEYFPG